MSRLIFPTMYGDHVLLREVLENLIENAQNIQKDKRNMTLLSL